MSKLSRLGGLAALVLLGAAVWGLAGYVSGNLNPQPEPPGIAGAT